MATLRLLHARGQQGTGSLQSWHVNEYDVKGDPVHIATLPNIAEGPLPLFPRLDVMPGSSSAYNDGEYCKEWGDYIVKKIIYLYDYKKISMSYPNNGKST